MAQNIAQNRSCAKNFRTTHISAIPAAKEQRIILFTPLLDQLLLRKQLFRIRHPECLADIYL